MTKKCNRPVKTQLGFMGQDTAISWCEMPHEHKGRCFDRWDLMALGKRIQRKPKKAS